VQGQRSQCLEAAAACGRRQREARGRWYEWRVVSEQVVMDKSCAVELAAAISDVMSYQRIKLTTYNRFDLNDFNILDILL
jgi:hypothetical protein